MSRTFDRRVVPDEMLDLVRACQRRVPCHLGGGAALSGVYLRHRLSLDVDLVCHTPSDVRTIVREFPTIASEVGLTIDLVRDAGQFVRAQVPDASRPFAVDLLFEGTPDVEPPPPPVEGVVVESLVELAASKLTCLLSRSEPRDLVDLLFLDRAGHPPEKEFPHALAKDAGLDPGILAWLLRQFPVGPLPLMLQPLSEEELSAFRDDLQERFRKMSLPELDP